MLFDFSMTDQSFILSNIKNTKFYDIYNGALAESKDEFSFNNFFLDNAAEVASLIERI